MEQSAQPQLPDDVDSPALTALGQFRDVIADAKHRRELGAAPAPDTEALLQEHGVDVASLPPNAKQVLYGLNEEDLRTISDACEKLKSAGLFMQLEDGGTLCFL